LQKEELFRIIHPYTMIYFEKRRNAIFDYPSKVVQNNIEGDFIECGVFNGGSAGILAHVLNKSKK